MIHGRNLVCFSHAVYITRSKDGRQEHSEGLQVILGEYSDIVEMTFLKCEDF